MTQTQTNKKYPAKGLSHSNSKIETKVGRPKEFDEDQVLERAMNYFWDHDYDSASLSDLLKAMKISKSSFYQTFSSKQRLFERCLALYAKEQIQWINKQLQHKTAVEILFDILHISISEIKEFGEIRGCLLMNNAEVCYKKYPDLCALIKQQFMQFHETFKTIINNGQQAGNISTYYDASTLSSIFINTLNGLSIMIKAGADKEMIEAVLKGFKQQLQTKQ